MKTCKNCGTLLPDNASYCDACGEPCSDTLSHKEYAERTHRKKTAKKVRRTILLSVLAIFVSIIVISVIAYIINEADDEYYGLGEFSEWKNFVSSDELEKVTFDMTYDEVKNILGEGILEASYDGGDYQYYFWPGEYATEEKRGYESFNTGVTIDFVRGKMSSIDEQNVFHGEEARKTFDTDFADLDVPEITREQAHKIDEGMTLSTVSQLLGGKGALIYSRTYRFSSGMTYKYDTYRWRCKTFDSPDVFDVEFHDGKVYHYYLGNYME